MTGKETSTSAVQRPSWRLALKSLLAAAWFAFVFFVSLPLLVLWLTDHDSKIATGPSALLGALLIFGASLLVLAQTVAFVREGQGTQAPFDPPRSLVSTGLYRWMRNPMYLEYVLIVAGEALLFASIPIGLYALFFVGLVHVYVVHVEEIGLKKRFGKSYEKYCDRVPRWIPRRPESW